MRLMSATPNARTTNLRGGLTLVCGFALTLGCAPTREVEQAPTPAESASARVASASPSAHAPMDVLADTTTASASATAQASASTSGSSAAVVPAGEPLPAVDAKRCILPAARPPDLSIRYMRVLMPVHEDRRQEGVELHAELACPAASGPRAALERLPCRRLTPGQLDKVYTEIRKAGFSSLESDTSGVYRSPHYGSRTIELVFGKQRCSFSDTSTGPVAPASEKAFFKMIDAITSP